MQGNTLSEDSRIKKATVFLTFIFLAVVSFSATESRASSDALSAADQKSLEIAFSLLANSLDAESELKWLVIFKKMTFHGPAKKVEAVMNKIQKASETRYEELQALRKLEPSVTGSPPPSPMGDAIEAAAQEAGTEELLFASGVFNIRFLFLQAQATRTDLRRFRASGQSRPQ